MKKVLLTLLMCVPVLFLSAQNCTPDPAFQDSTGVFPMPYDPMVSPDGGINECAVIGESYEFSFTVGVGDSLTIDLQGNELTLELEKITINNVSGLPIGMAVVYEPQSAVYPANSIGCAKLTGIPTSDNSPGDYDLIISATVSFVNPFIPDQNVTFPDENFAPGKYTLKLLADAGDFCDAVSTKESLADKVYLTINPNPTVGPSTIEVNSKTAGDFDLHVIGLLGQSVHRESIRINEGQNNFDFDGSFLPNGLYILVLENELGRIAQKMTIQH